MKNLQESVLHGRSMPGSDKSSFIHIGPILGIFIFFLAFLLSDTVLVLLVQMSNQHMKTVFHKGTSIWKAVHLMLQFLVL